MTNPVQKPPRRFSVIGILGLIVYGLLVVSAAVQGFWNIFWFLIAVLALAISILYFPIKAKEKTEPRWRQNDE